MISFGLLTAALPSPVGRYVLLSKLEETLVVHGERFELCAFGLTKVREEWERKPRQ